MANHSKHGFTLVELSVVLVIIALIVAGITGGTSLLRSSKIRAVVGEVQTYQGAFTLFVEKYRNYPGDFARAVGAGNPFERSTAITQDGDGDGQIEFQSSDPNEGIMAWQHLGIEGLVEFNVDKDNENDNAAAVGTNIPGSAFEDNTGYSFNHDTAFGGNHMLLGKTDGSGINDTDAITPRDAFLIDEKIDDAQACSGRVFGTDDTGCLTAACSSSGDYDKTLTTAQCSMYFEMD